MNGPYSQPTGVGHTLGLGSTAPNTGNQLDSKPWFKTQGKP
jgi:hypothetical protein